MKLAQGCPETLFHNCILDQVWEIAHMHQYNCTITYEDHC